MPKNAPPQGRDPDVGSAKVQANVEAYSSFVVNQLVGIKGRSPSDVLAFILKDWIGDHREELATYEIDVANWRKTRSK